MSVDPFDREPRGPLTSDDNHQRKAATLDSIRAERQALSVFAVVAIAAIVWVVQPVGIGILLGMLIAFTMQPFYERLVKRHGRHGLIALGCVIVSTIALIATVGGLTSLFITRGSVMIQVLIGSLGPDGKLRELGMRLASRPGPLHFQFVLGVPGGIGAREEIIEFMAAQIPVGSTWAVAAVGRHQKPMTEAALRLGGHARVGLEDNIYLSKGVLSEGSAPLVTQAAAYARSIGRTPVSPERARAILGLPTKAS